MRLRPVAQAAVSIDMATLADVDKTAAPYHGELLRLRKAAKRVVAGRKHGAFKRQLLEWNHPAREHLTNIGAGGVGRRDQQCCFDEMRILRMRCPSSHRQAAQAVRDQHRRLAAAEQHVFKPGNPVAAPRALPVVLFHPLVAVLALPAALPVVRPAVLPAGQNEDVFWAQCN